MSTTTPNRRPVATGVEVPERCNNPEHKWEVGFSLIRDFLPKIVRLEGSTADQLGGANSFGLIEIEGPRQGFLWEIARLSGSVYPLVVGGNSQLGSVGFFSAQLWECDPGTGDNTDLFPSGSAQPMVSIPANQDAASQFFGFSETFDAHTVTINPGKNLVVFINGLGLSDPVLNFVISGQAIEIPQAYYNSWLS